MSREKRATGNILKGLGWALAILGLAVASAKAWRQVQKNRQQVQEGEE